VGEMTQIRAEDIDFSKSYSLYALAFHNPDLLFRQPVKLVDQGSYLPAWIYSVSINLDSVARATYIISAKPNPA